MEKEISWKLAKIWKPNFIQRVLIKLKLIKDKRCKPSIGLLDEAGMWGRRILK